MAATLTANEEAQLLQTIEMFEVITQSQPQDYQSLEILKEAYSKLGKNQEVVNTSKRIAQAYVQLGQLSSAILEYESILQRFPDDPDVLKALADIENRANTFAQPASAAPEIEAPAEKPGMAPGVKKPVDGKPAAPGEIDDGKLMMQKVFVDGKLISVGDFNLYWPTPNLAEPPKQPIDPFIQVLADKQLLPLDKAIKALSDKARVPFLPIDKYDIDVELTRSFPREVCLRWCIVPFDKMSKSVLVATANPYNKQAQRELEAATKGRLLWYVSNPTDLMKILKKIFR